MYLDTITLFNRVEGTEGDTWYPTVIRNADLNMDRAAVIAKYGAESTDGATLHVRFTKQGNDLFIAGKKYLPPKEWEKQLDHSNTVTFTPGDRFDFFFLGEWEEGPVSDVDYALYLDFYTYMNKTHDHVYAVTSVGGPYSVIPHFEILGK